MNDPADEKTYAVLTDIELIQMMGNQSSKEADEKQKQFDMSKAGYTNTDVRIQPEERTQDGLISHGTYEKEDDSISAGMKENTKPNDSQVIPNLDYPINQIKPTKIETNMISECLVPSPEKENSYEGGSPTSMQEENRTRLFCEPCLIEEERNEVSAFCLKCIEYLCKNCLKDHKKNKMTRDHKCLHEKEMPLSKKPFELIESYGMCKKHTDMDVKYICVDHNEFVCAECERMFHRRCEKIEDIETQENLNKEGDPACSFVAKIESSILEVSNQNKERDDNINTLKTDLGTCLDNIEESSKRAIEEIGSFKVECQTAANEIVEEHARNIKQIIEVGKEIIREVKEIQQVMQVAIQYASRRQIKIVTKLMETQHSDLMAKFKSFKDYKKVKVKFSEESGNISNFKLGCIRVEDGKTEVIKPCENEFENTFLSDLANGSDSIGTESTNNKSKPKTENHHPLISCPIHLYGSINAHQMDVGNTANIVGSAFLKDNVVLIDKSNSLFLVYDSFLTLKAYLKLASKPLGLCGIGENTVIISLEEKKIQRYIISDDRPSLLNEFPTKLHCRGISSAGMDVALLLSDEKYETDIDDSDIIEVQVRKVHNGHKIREGDSFFDNDGKAVKMKDPRCLLYTDKNHVLIGEKKYLADFNESFKRQKFFKSYKNHHIGDIRALTSDDEGNIYLCGYETNNVHQVSLNNFYQNRILIKYIQNPCCIAFDDKRKRLLVGCSNSDLLHIYHFKKGETM